MDLMNNLFAALCFFILMVVIALALPIGFVIKSRHDKSCVCNWCDRYGKKAKRLGVKNS